MATILIIDDDAGISRLLQEGLGRAGHRALICCNRREFLDELKSQRIDLLITDLFMDHPDGLEIIAKVRAACPELKIIAISGGTRLTDQDYLSVARMLGAHATFHKPFDLNLLAETISQLV